MTASSALPATGDRLAERLGLVVITDDRLAGRRGVVAAVRSALAGRAPAVQLRSKEASARELVELARALRKETAAAGALLFVNDRVDVALAAGADGAHLGDDDLPLAAARRIVPAGFILGRSVDTPEEARTAEREGADYVGVGPVYATGSKIGLGAPIGPDGVRAVVDAVRLPVVGIGGIEAEGAEAVARAGAAGVAVIRSVMAADDPESAVRDLLDRVERGRSRR